MPTYDYRCDTCDSVLTCFYKIADKPQTVKCDCGGTADAMLGAPMVLKASYLDGQRRKGFADLKEASKLKAMANDSRADVRKDIQKEIKKMGVKVSD
jgi:putative FmdB family regulatory protein